VYVEEVRALFDQYIDEPDLTFLTVAQRRNALARGYDSFRQVVIDGDHWAYNKTQDYAIASTAEIDLSTAAPALLGATATPANKMLRLRRIAILDDQNNIWQFVENVRTLDPVLPRAFLDQWQDAPTQCALVNTKLLFSRNLQATVRLYYLPGATVDWTKDTAGDNEFVDDYDQFHKLIAMYAARDYYATRDAEIHQKLQMQIAVEEDRLRGFLGVGRDTEANSKVAERF
tara:strand:- start:17 stop:706 length:690 start_codon:yes stop_codon:yes gene_type:complete